MATPSSMLPLGTSLPAVRLTDAATGSQVDVTTLSEGKRGVLVAFICNHCPYVVHMRKELVRVAHEAIDLGFAVAAAPGPSAALAALCVAGLPTDRFYFEGFLPPRQAARRERINALAAAPGTLIFYEAPGRLAETLADLALELGPRPAAVARELTKLHEEVRRGALDKLAAEYSAGETPRGEIVIVVAPAEARPLISEATLDREIAEQLTKLSVKDAAAAIAAKHGLPRRQVYARALALAGAQR